MFCRVALVFRIQKVKENVVNRLLSLKIFCFFLFFYLGIFYGLQEKSFFLQGFFCFMPKRSFFLFINLPVLNNDWKKLFFFFCDTKFGKNVTIIKYFCLGFQNIRLIISFLCIMFCKFKVKLFWVKKISPAAIFFRKLVKLKTV